MDHLRIAGTLAGRLIGLSVPLAVSWGFVEWGRGTGAAGWIQVPAVVFAVVVTLAALWQLSAAWAAHRCLALQYFDYLAPASVNVQGTGNSVSVASPVVNHQLVPVNVGGAHVNLIEGFMPADLAFFVDRSMALGRFGVSERNWLNVDLPSGRTIASVEDWRALLSPFAKVGLMENVGVERKAARWTVSDPVQVKQVLGLPVRDPVVIDQ